METFYFTFGSGSPTQPYSGGWVEVHAPNVKTACKVFARRFGRTADGLLPCCDYYPQDSSAVKDMLLNYNLGAGCYERLYYADGDKDVMEVHREGDTPVYTITLAEKKTFGKIEKNEFFLRKFIGTGTYKDGQKFEVCTSMNYSPMLYVSGKSKNDKGKAFVLTWDDIVGMAEAAGFFEEEKA